jgi:mono/diheme cytochrome c family protein
VIALSGTDTSGASSVGLGSLPVSTYSASTSTSSSSGSSTPTSGGGGSSGGGVTGDVNAGKAVFASAGCAGCHTLSAAGATGSVGPNLDTSLAESAGSTPLPAFIKESIVDPNKVIASGFTANVMPDNFGTTLSSTDIDNLVALIMSDQK